jgi:predicted RNA-binding protein
VKYLVSPTKLHVWRLEAGHELFPDGTLWGPRQIREQFKRLPLAGILGDKPPADWMDDLDQLVFKGNLLIEEVFFFHKRSRTLIVADFIQNHRTVAGKVFENTLFKLSGVAYPHGGVPRDIRLTFANRKLARRSLERVLSWDFDRLIIAHGVCIAGEAKRFVKKAFRWLAR